MEKFDGVSTARFAFQPVVCPLILTFLLFRFARRTCHLRHVNCTRDLAEKHEHLSTKIQHVTDGFVSFVFDCNTNITYSLLNPFSADDEIKKCQQ